MRSGMFGVLGRLVRAIVDVCYPPRCAVCEGELGGEEAQLCAACEAELPLIRPPCCPVCSRPVRTREGQGLVCGACRLRPNGPLARVVAAGDYDSGLRRLIHQYKYRRYAFLAGPLGALLGRQARALGIFEGADWLVPIPLHWTRQRWRGFNQARELARRLTSGSGVPVLPDGCLRRVRRTTPQVLLDASGRKENIKGAFAVRREELVRGRCVVLVDDVYTTGATANECARVLVHAGVEEVRLLVLAR